METRTVASIFKNIVSVFSSSRPIEVSGWIRSARFSKNVGFVMLTDGSTIETLQIVLSKDMMDQYKAQLTTGTSIKVTGVVNSSIGTEQKYEMHADSITIIGDGKASESPLQKKEVSLEFLRTIPHLRTRTDTFIALGRIRSCLSKAIHDFMELNQVSCVHTPVITTADCEGAGEAFKLAEQENHLFFGTPVTLTVSGQLQLEAAMYGLGPVYTFGPTFRAENSNTGRHAAEFWMLEVELPHKNARETAEFAMLLIKFCIDTVLEKCADELQFIHEKYGRGEVSRNVISRDNNKPDIFITYAEAKKLLAENVAAGHSVYEYPVDYDEPLRFEHEKDLALWHGQPIVITDYPKDQKAFYMYENRGSDPKTVAAFDIIFPGVGEIVGGSQRETDYDRLVERMAAQGIDIPWYAELRKYGPVTHSGFGLGFDRLIMYLTRMHNIRDMIPFPRTPGQAKC